MSKKAEKLNPSRGAVENLEMLMKKYMEEEHHNSDTGGSGGLSGGATAGITIAVTFLVGIIIIAIFVRRRRRGPLLAGGTSDQYQSIRS